MSNLLRVLLLAVFFPKSEIGVEISCNHVIKQLSLDIWHKRVGHIPYRRMALLPLNVDSKHAWQDTLYDVCTKAKQ